MNVKSTPLNGVLIIEPDKFVDHRGFLLQVWHQQTYGNKGITGTFVQDNHSRSYKNVIRGLHYQLRHPQGKLIFVINGKIFDVAVDIRLGSPTFGQWFGAILSDENHLQMFIPPGFAHGFCVLSETADLIYKCTDFYYPEDQFGVDWADPGIGINWPVEGPILSGKDSKLPFLKDIPRKNLPRFEEI